MAFTGGGNFSGIYFVKDDILNHSMGFIINDQDFDLNNLDKYVHTVKFFGIIFRDPEVRKINIPGECEISYVTVKCENFGEYLYNAAASRSI